MEFTRGRLLQPLVIASVEILYNMKESRRMGVTAQSPRKIFSTMPFK